MKTIDVSSSPHFKRMLTKADGAHRARQASCRGVPTSGLDMESVSLGTNPKFLRILRQSYGELDRGERISMAEMRRRMGVPAKKRV
jgi:hypothetical protein